MRLVNEGKGDLASFIAVVDSLGMPVNGIYDPWEVTIDDWRAEAVDCGLDPDRVERVVVQIATRLRGID